MTRSGRVDILVALSKELEKCGSVYLAAVLVEEAFGRECLEEIAFGKGNLDTAVLKVAERLCRQIRMSQPAAEPAAIEAPKRGRRRPVARVSGLLERVELKGRGEELPDTRRRPKAAA